MTGSRFHEVDVKFSVSLSAATAAWLEHVLTHYVIPEKGAKFHYQIDRIMAVRMRRTLLAFMEAKGEPTYYLEDDDAAAEAGVGTDRSDGHCSCSGHEQDDGSPSWVRDGRRLNAGRDDHEDPRGLQL